MKRNILSDKLDELYKKEQYNHPIQKRPEPKAGISGEKPNEDDLGTKYQESPKDEEEVKKDLGKGSEKDLGKGSEKDLGIKKKSQTKNWEFEGPRDAIKQED